MKNPLVPGGYKGWDWTSDEAHGALRARRDLSDRHLAHPPIVVVRERAQRQPRRLRRRRARAADPTADVGASPPSGGPGYFAFLFSVSIRSLAAGPDDAGFWPVIS